MNCAIILLTLCAFETVYAEHQSNGYEAELKDLHEKYTNKMRVIVSQFHDEAMNLVVRTQKRNTQVGRCLAEYQELERYREAEMIKCDRCYENALRHGYIKVAERCYIRQVINLNNDKASRQQEIRNCIFEIVTGLSDVYTLRRAPIQSPSTSNQSKIRKV